jgi:hypothetical protein
MYFSFHMFRVLAVSYFLKNEFDRHFYLAKLSHSVMQDFDEIEAMVAAARLAGNCGRHESLHPLMCFDVPTCTDPTCVYNEMWTTDSPNPK